MKQFLFSKAYEEFETGLTIMFRVALSKFILSFHFILIFFFLFIAETEPAKKNAIREKVII